MIFDACSFVADELSSSRCITLFTIMFEVKEKVHSWNGIILDSVAPLQRFQTTNN